MNLGKARDRAANGTLFAGLELAAFDALLSSARTRHYAPGAMVFHQGDPPGQLHQVCCGRVKLTQVNPHGVQTTLRFTGPGDLIGCVAVFQQFPFPVTAAATLQTTTLCWSAAQIRELMGRFPAIAANALSAVGVRARENAELLLEFTQKSVEQRIACVLLRLGRQIGRACDGGVALETSMIRRDIAEMSGVNYFTVSRALSEWQKLGIVCTGRERIVIATPQKLREIAG